LLRHLSRKNSEKDRDISFRCRGLFLHSHTCIRSEMTFKLLLIFAVTELLLSMTPGPAVLLVISQGMKFNARSSIRGAAGILTGNAIYFALSAVGLGTLLVASASLFQIIKWLGAAYLVFIGIKMLLSKNSNVNELEQANEIQSSRRLFTQGLITQ